MMFLYNGQERGKMRRMRKNGKRAPFLLALAIEIISVFSVSGAEPGTDIPEAAMTETAQDSLMAGAGEGEILWDEEVIQANQENFSGE